MILCHLSRTHEFPDAARGPISVAAQRTELEQLASESRRRRFHYDHLCRQLVVWLATGVPIREAVISFTSGATASGDHGRLAKVLVAGGRIGNRKHG